MSDNKTKKYFRIDLNGYQEVLDRVRHPLYIIKDDLQRDKVSRTTYQHIEKIFNFLQEMGDENTWDVQNADEQDGKLLDY
mgnify:CR=1 FL=1